MSLVAAGAGWAEGFETRPRRGALVLPRLHELEAVVTRYLSTGPHAATLEGGRLVPVDPVDDSVAVRAVQWTRRGRVAQVQVGLRVVGGDGAPGAQATGVIEVSVVTRRVLREQLRLTAEPGPS